jgi:hypothetical protein
MPAASSLVARLAHENATLRDYVAYLSRTAGTFHALLAVQRRRSAELAGQAAEHRATIRYMSGRK